MPKLLKAAVLGGSGNVGAEIVKGLIKNEKIGQVLLVTRRHLKQFDSPKTRQVIVSMENDGFFQECAHHLQNVNIAFVTMGVGAPSKSTPEEIQLVDVSLPTEFAR